MNYSITAEQAVEAGVVLLDEFIPDWVERIDWEVLDIAFGDTCILGQLNADWDTNLFELLMLEGGFLSGARYGFEMVAGWYSYGQLNDAWQQWHEGQV